MAPHRRKAVQFVCPVELQDWFSSDVEPHECDMRRYLTSSFRLDKADVDDVVQEAYLRLIRIKENDGRIRYLAGFLFTTIRNIALDQIRRAKASPLANVPMETAAAVSADSPGTAELASIKQEHALLGKAIEQLPQRCREAMRLHHLQSLTQRETAVRLGISERAVNEHIRVGMERCAKYLAARGVGRRFRR